MALILTICPLDTYMYTVIIIITDNSLHGIYKPEDQIFMVMIMMMAVVALMRVDLQHQLLITEKRRLHNKLV